MKIILTLFLFHGMAILTGCTGTNVPLEVKKAFAKQYPGAKPHWEKEDGNYEADFKVDGHEQSAVFDAAGILLESEVEIPEGELPEQVKNYVATHYKDTPIKEASKITRPGGIIEFEAAIKGKDLMFDSNGNFIKEIND